MFGYFIGSRCCIWTC